MHTVHIGTCGFCLRQAEVFARFRLLEVQQTFYHPPRLATVTRWREAAPDEFRFTLKAWQAITHLAGSPTYRRSKLTAEERRGCGFFRDTPEVRSAWETTRQLATALEAEFVVFQSPPNFLPSEENVRQLREFFGWARRDQLRFGWEPRHKTWTPALVAELCRELNLVHVVDPFYEDSAYGQPRYFRLHGRPRGEYRWDYVYRYEDAELQTLREKCLAAETYCLFNNDRMCDDAQRFAQLLDVSVSLPLQR